MAARMHQTPSKQYLESILSLDRKTGALKWKRRPQEHFFSLGECKRWNKRYANKAAFTCINLGYFVGRINKRNYLAHRIIWVMEHGSQPQFIDHINGDRSDNRIENLRSVSRQENAQNICLSNRNASGVIGVSYSKDKQRWLAQISYKRKRLWLGTFKRKDQAIQARKLAELKFGFHKNHGRAAA